MTVVASAVAATALMVAGALGAAASVWHRAAPPAAAVPPPQAQLESHAASQARAARTYTWPAVPGAHTYRIRIFRGRQPVWNAITSAPTVELPARLHLSPGRYTWSATPGFEERALDAGARPVVEETFQVSPGA